MSISTKGGDGGKTSLIGGMRVSKADLRVEAYGTVDELDAALGFARSICTNQRYLRRFTKFRKHCSVSVRQSRLRRRVRRQSHRSPRKMWTGLQRWFMPSKQGRDTRRLVAAGRAHRIRGL